jgi:hypothetical protein
MYSFRQYLEEIRIARHNMPQVDSHHLEDMLQWIGDKGISVSRGSIDPKQLIPMQDINPKSVSSIVRRKPKEALEKPILISGDNHLLDGHHRWKASIELNRKVKFIRIHLPAMKALNALKKYPKTEFRGMGQKSGQKYDKELAV